MVVNKIMKILCSGLLLLFCIIEAGAQTIMNGKVTVSNLAVSRTEDKLSYRWISMFRLWK